jgi:transposase-like protein
MVSEMIAQQGRYGMVSQMSQSYTVSRQTLYTWKGKGEPALQAVFEPKEKLKEQAGQLERAVLTVLTEGHASYRGIQVCLQILLGLQVS